MNENQNEMTRTHRIWTCMKTRCYNPKNNRYHRYGGRGIKVCERWQTFANFLADMGPAPTDMSIERDDNDGNYEPNNCRWATRREQQNNCRNNFIVEFQGKRLTVAQWSRALGIRYSTLMMRLTKYKWTVENALTFPIRKVTPWK